MTYFRDVEAAASAHQQAQESYLQRWGWSRTCNTPGAFWMWRRDFADVDAERAKNRPEATPYGIMTVSRDTAVAMTIKCLDERDEDQGDHE